jgi:hypothetical protein
MQREDFLELNSMAQRFRVVELHVAALAQTSIDKRTGGRVLGIPDV